MSVVEETDARSLFRRILETDDLDFLCFAVTPWHALGIDAFLLDLNARLCRQPRGLVIITSHRAHGYLLSEDRFVSPNFADVSFLKIKDRDLDASQFLGRRLLFLKVLFSLAALLGLRLVRFMRRATAKSLYVVSPRLQSLFSIILFRSRKVSRRYKPVYVAVEEGMGTYFFSVRSRLRGQKMDFKPSQSGLKADLELARLITRTILFSLLVNMVKQENYFLFENVRSMLSAKPNEKVVHLYRRVLKMRCAEKSLVLPFPPNLKPRIVLIITQPLSESGLMSEQDEYQLFETLFEILFKNNLHAIIKPHPREKSGKYNHYATSERYSSMLKVQETEQSLEEYIASYESHMNFVAVAGVFSTAIVTARVLFNIDAICIARLMPNKSITKSMQIFSQKFISLTKSMVFAPANWEQLDSFLQRLPASRDV